MSDNTPTLNKMSERLDQFPVNWDDFDGYEVDALLADLFEIVRAALKVSDE